MPTVIEDFIQQHILDSIFYYLDLRTNRELLNSDAENSVVFCVRDILCIKKAASLPWSRLECKGAGRKGGKGLNSQCLLKGKLCHPCCE